MKNLIQTLIASFLLLSGVSAQAFSTSECPQLAGEYKDGKKRKTISESRSDSTYKLTLGEGAFEMTVDGLNHPTPDQSAQYQASCQNGTLTILVSAGGQTGTMQFYFKNSQTLDRKSVV